MSPGWSRVDSARAWLFVAVATWALSPIALADSATATLSVTGDGSTVTVDLRGPAAYLVGFERAPRDADERATLALAAENLKAGDGLVRFNPEAACRLEESRIDDDPTPTTTTAKDKKRGELGATWRFQCDLPDRLDSAAIGLFVGFPALARAHVRYALGPIRGEAVLTGAKPVVTFVPLQ